MAVLILLTNQYLKVSTENKTVTIIIGEGHEVLAGSFIECVNEDYREIVFAERENEESNTVVLNVFNGNIGTKGVIDLSNDTLNKILGESKKDNDQKFYITALKEFTQYQDKNEVEEEYKTLDEAELENGDVFYVKTKGSVIIRLKDLYLETLSAGKHELKAHFLDKEEVSIEITIKEKTSPAYIIPVTGIEE